MVILTKKINSAKNFDKRTMAAFVKKSNLTSFVKSSDFLTVL